MLLFYEAMPHLNLGWRYWKRIPRWLAQPRLFWVFLSVVVAASLVGDWLGIAAGTYRQDRIRYAGYLLEVCGLISVAFGLSRKLDLFHGKSVWRLVGETTYDWLRRFPLLRQDKNVLTASGHVTIGSPTAEGYGKVKIDPNRSDKEKLEWLLERYYDLCDIVQAAQRDVRANKRECERQLQELRVALEDAIGKVEAQTARAHVGEIGGEFVGLGWILFGITFATVPEFVRWAFWWLIVLCEWIGDLINIP